MPLCLTTALWLKGVHPGLPGMACPLRTLTGLPCPTCYLTRATSAALTGNLAESVQWHAFGPLIAGALIAWSAVSLRNKQLMPKGLSMTPMLGAGLGGSLLAYWLWRLWQNSWPPG